jgi:hypothetical protein
MRKTLDHEAVKALPPTAEQVEAEEEDIYAIDHSYIGRIAAQVGDVPAFTLSAEALQALQQMKTASSYVLEIDYDEERE